MVISGSSLSLLSMLTMLADMTILVAQPSWLVLGWLVSILVYSCYWNTSLHRVVILPLLLTQYPCACPNLVNC